jgi:hypothetical protein
MSLVEVPDLDSDSPISLFATADDNGNIINTSFATNILDANIHFTLTAVGAVSQAQTTFTDATNLHSLTVGAQSLNPVVAGNSATFNPVTVGFSGSGTCTADLSITTAGGQTGLPSGAVPTFGSASVTGSSTTTVSTTLSISTLTSTSAATYTFTVTATPESNCGNGSSAQNVAASLVVSAPAVGHITVTKTTNPTSDTTTQFPITLSSTTGGTSTQNVAETLTGNGGSFTYDVTPGTYSIAETAVTGWDQTANTCTTANLIVAAGQTVTCGITNQRKPTLTVTKTLVPSSDPGRFNLIVGGITTFVAASNVGDGGTVTLTLNPGSYAVAEAPYPLAAPPTVLSNYFRLIGGDCGATGIVSLNYGDTKSCTITNVRATVAVTPSTTDNVVANQPQYSDPVTFTATIYTGGDSSLASLATSAEFWVGTQTLSGATDMGGCTLAEDATTHNLTCSITKPLIDPGPPPTPPQQPPTGNFAPVLHTVYAVFGGVATSPAWVAPQPTTPLTINQEDAEITYTGLNYYSTTSTATSMNVPVSFTLQDATAAGVAAIYDAYAGDITNAKVTLTLTPTGPGPSQSCSSSPVLVAVPGEVDPTNKAPSTATISCTINNVAVPGSYNLTAMPAAGSYYAFMGDTNESITTANGGTGFITGGGFQTALYLETAGPSGSGKYMTAGLLMPAPKTKMNFGFQAKYNKKGSNLQGGANIIIRSACVTGISGYTPVPGDDGLCVYQIKTNGNGNITSLSEDLTAPNPPNNAVFTARNVTIQDVTGAIPLVLTGNASLQLNMYDVAEPGANTDTLAIYVTDPTNGLWISNNWSGAQTIFSITVPVIQGGNLQVH